MRLVNPSKPAGRYLIGSYVDWWNTGPNCWREVREDARGNCRPLKVGARGPPHSVPFSKARARRTTQHTCARVIAQLAQAAGAALNPDYPSLTAEPAERRLGLPLHRRPAGGPHRPARAVGGRLPDVHGAVRMAGALCATFMGRGKVGGVRSGPKQSEQGPGRDAHGAIRVAGAAWLEWVRFQARDCNGQGEVGPAR